MKLKLSHADYMALYGLLKVAVFNGRETEMQKKLLQILIIRIYKKFHKQELEVKKLYSIKIDEEEAIAFWLYFGQLALSPTSHTGNLVDNLRNVIHQKFI
jgi:hypothetical protein